MLAETIPLQAASIPEVLLKIFLLLAVILLFFSILVGVGLYKIYQLLFGERYRDTRELAVGTVDRSSNMLADFFNSPAGQATIALLESFAASEDTSDSSAAYTNSSNPPTEDRRKTKHSQTKTKTQTDKTSQQTATANKKEVRINEYGEIER
jgi:hypothetical protein